MEVARGQPCPEIQLGNGWYHQCVRGQDLDEPSEDLRQAIDLFKSQAEKSEKQELKSLQSELEAALKGVSTLCEKRKPNNNDLITLRDKIRYGRSKVCQFSEKACRIALHYQKIFDVLNEQAPEYSSIPWGAVKLLLLLVVNNMETKESIEKNLDYIVGKFENLDLITQYKAHERVVDAATAAYSSFMVFLAEATRFFTENKLKRFFKSFTHSWELRFKPLIEDIDLKTSQVEKIAQTLFQKRAEISLDGVHASNSEIMAILKDFQRKALLVEEAEKRPPLKTIEVPDEEGRSKFADLPFDPSQSRSATSSSTGDWLHDRFDDLFSGVLQVEMHARDLVTEFIEDMRENCDGAQKLEYDKHVKAWLESNSMHNYRSGGQKAKVEFDWLNRFSLKVLMAVEQRDLICLHAFVGIVKTSKGSERISSENVIQSLIFQLLDQARRVVGSGSVLKRVKTTESQTCKASGNMKDLLGILKEAVQLASVKSLFVIFDYIQAIVDPTTTNSGREARVEAEEVINALLKLMHDEKSGMKVLISSHPPGLLRRATMRRIVAEPKRHYMVSVANRKFLGRLYGKRHKLKESPMPTRTEPIKREDLYFLDEDSEPERDIQDSQSFSQPHLDSENVGTDHRYYEDEEDIAGILKEANRGRLVSMVSDEGSNSPDPGGLTKSKLDDEGGDEIDMLVAKTQRTQTLEQQKSQREIVEEALKDNDENPESFNNPEQPPQIIVNPKSPANLNFYFSDSEDDTDSPVNQDTEATICTEAMDDT